MRKIYTLILILFIPTISFANSVYQCTVDGVSTFSQTPCDDQYNKIDIYVSSGGSASQSDSTLECIEHLKTKYKFQDPESIRVEGSKKTWVTDNSGGRQVLVLELNAKNSYGAYGGSKSYSCFLNHNGTKLSKVQYLIE